MATQFEFHLSGAGLPEGELEADHLLAIVASLKEIATRIGRSETAAERLGRAPERTRQIAKLLIGLEPGSTRVMARRAGSGEGSLEFEMAEEQSFDAKFTAIVESIADDVRPPWVGDSLASATADLTWALKQAAPEVEFKVDGEPRRRFETAMVHRETWRVAPVAAPNEITFIGRLFAVNLKTHRLQVQDDVGHRIALPKVTEDAVAGRLLNTYVAVTGVPEYDSERRLTYIHHAVIEAVDDSVGGFSPVPAVSLDSILASAPGIDVGGIGLTEQESDEFYTAMGL